MGRGKGAGMKKEEKDLFPPLKRWLKNDGYRVYSEMSNPVAGHCLIDCVAIKDDIVEAYEMKLSLTQYSIHQAYRSILVSDFSYVVISTNPKEKGINECKKFGIGIIQIKDNKASLILKAELNRFINSFRLKMIGLCSMCEEGEEAGLPNRKGIGVTYDIVDKIKEYKSINTKAGWKELWENIENHYSSPSSMASALNKWRGFSLSLYKQSPL